MAASEEQAVSAATLLVQSVLIVPADFIAARVHNAREAELLLQVSSTASKFATALSVYEVLALKLDALKKSWDELWLSNEMTPQIPLVGHAMSQQNAARGAVLQQVEELATCLERQAAALHQFADMRADLARELSAEGLHKLAADKLLLSTVEKELASRITSICTTGGLAHLCPMSKFVNSLQASVAKPQEQPVSVDPDNGPVAVSHATPGEHPCKQQVPDVSPVGSLAEVAGSLARMKPSAASKEAEIKLKMPVGPNSLEGALVPSLIEQGAYSRQEARPQHFGQEAAMGQGKEAWLSHHGPEFQPRTSDGVHPDGPFRKRPRDDAGEEQGKKAQRKDSAIGEGQAPQIDKQLEGTEDRGRGSLAALTPTVAATCLVRQRAEEEAAGKESGLQEVDSARSLGLPAVLPLDISNASERKASAPASDVRADREVVHHSSPKEGRQHKDGSLSSAERQLLTDERLTPTSPSASRSPLTHTQSPPSTSRGQSAPNAHVPRTEAEIPMQKQQLDSPAYAGSKLTRLSNSSSSPSKSPGSVTLSQTGQQGEGVLSRGSQDEQPGNVAVELPSVLASGLQTGEALADAPDSARSPPGCEVQRGGKAGEQKEGTANKPGEGQHIFQAAGGPWRQRRQVGNTSVSLGEGALEAGEEIAPSAASLSEMITEPEGLNTKPPAGWLDAPASYPGVSAYEPPWQATPSPPTQSQSMQAAEFDRAADDRVPDSEETRSQSSGRGAIAGPTPPPSSRSSSLGNKHEDGPRKQAGTDDNESGEKTERAACSQGEWDDEMTQSGATELVPETEEMDEDSPQRLGGQDTLPLAQEAAHAESPCRTQESPALSGSHPASQSPIF